jgi:single-stranded-DNA-specific exonuclease
MAGGLSLAPDQLPALRDWMRDHMATFREARAAARELHIDAVLSTAAVTVETIDQIETLGPFGQAAPEPVFALSDVSITHTRRIGDLHLKCTIEDGHNRFEALAWRVVGTPLGDGLIQPRRVHLAGRLKVNDWQGRRRPQFEVIDAAPAD